MPNTYFNLASPITRFTTADAIRLNNILKAVEAGFDKLPSSNELNQGSRNFAIATGTANTYSVTVPFALTSYQAGLSINALVMIANNGPSTLNVNGIGQATIKRADGANLVQGDIRASSLNNFVHDGTAFRLTSFHGGSEAITSANATAATNAAASAQASASSAAASSASAQASASSASASSATAVQAVGSSRYGLKNILINNLFWMSQRSPGVFSGANSGGFIRDRWIATNSTWGVANATLNISTGTITQVVQGRNVPFAGKYVLSWSGTSTARVHPIYGQSSSIAVQNGVPFDLPGFQNMAISFYPGTVYLPQLEFGSIKTSPEHRPVDVDRELCYQYYQKSYNDDVRPGTVTDQGAYHVYSIFQGHWESNTVAFQVPMRDTPSIIILNPRNLNMGGSLHNLGNNLSYGYQIALSSEKSFMFYNSSGDAPASNGYIFHWTADAEL